MMDADIVSRKKRDEIVELPPIDLRVQHHLARRLQLTQSASFSFYIDIVGTCNLRCPSCAVGNSKPYLTHGFMDRDLYSQILDKVSLEYAQHATIFVDLYNWGEPGLHPDLAGIVTETKTRGFGVGISTNLNVFRNMRDVVKASPDYIRVSLSGFYQDVYSRTHASGSIYAVKSNLYQLRELMDRYEPATVVQTGFHIYRSNFPRDFIAIRSLCDELGFLFSPVLATLMPAEIVADISVGKPAAVQDDLREQLVISVEKSLEVFRTNGGPMEDCQHRQARTTIAHDGSVALCCAVYGPDKQIARSFLDHSPEALKERKYGHPFCATCMSNHVNKMYIGYNRNERNELAISVLGPLYKAYLGETRYLGDPDHVVHRNTFYRKDELYRLGMDSLHRGAEFYADAESYFDALVDGAPNFAEGFFQAGNMARRLNKPEKAERLLAEAVSMAPDNPNYVAALRAAREASGSGSLEDQKRVPLQRAHVPAAISKRGSVAGGSARSAILSKTRSRPV